MRYKYTLGIDPSGNFKEGFGTTGWNVFDNTLKRVVEVGSISAKQHKSAVSYWKTHKDLILKMHEKYKSMNVVIEGYVLYGSKAMSQTNSELETPQLIGALKLACYEHRISTHIRNAVVVKNRWTNGILMHHDIIIKTPLGFVLPGMETKLLCNHELDSIRHSVHFSMFENEEDNNGSN